MQEGVTGDNTTVFSNVLVPMTAGTCNGYIIDTRFIFSRYVGAVLPGQSYISDVSAVSTLHSPKITLSEHLSMMSCLLKYANLTDDLVSTPAKQGRLYKVCMKIFRERRRWRIPQLN